MNEKPSRNRQAVWCDKPDFDAFNAARGRIPQAVQFKALMASWQRTPIEVRLQILQGCASNPGDSLPPGEPSSSIDQDAIDAQRACTDVIECVVVAKADNGRIDAHERPNIRGRVRRAMTKLCNVGAHVAEPVPA